MCACGCVVHVCFVNVPLHTCSQLLLYVDVSVFPYSYAIHTVCVTLRVCHVTDGGPREKRGARGRMRFKLKSNSRICSKYSAKPLRCHSDDP